MHCWKAYTNAIIPTTVKDVQWRPGEIKMSLSHANIFSPHTSRHFFHHSSVYKKITAVFVRLSEFTDEDLGLGRNV